MVRKLAGKWNCNYHMIFNYDKVVTNYFQHTFPLLVRGNL